MSEGKTLTSDKVFSLLPLGKLMSVQTANAANPINIDSIVQSGMVFDMGSQGTKPSGLTASGNMYLTLVGNSDIRFQICFAWNSTPRILVRSMAQGKKWSAWYPVTLGTPLT